MRTGCGRASGPWSASRLLATLALRPGGIERDGAEEGALAIHLMHLGEARLAQPRGEPAREVVPCPTAVVDHRGERTLEPVPGRPEVEQMERAALAQHPPDLPERLLLLLATEVVDHERRDHVVEARGRKRNAAAVARLPADRDTGLAGLALGERERLRVGIEPHDLGPGLAPCEQQRERAGATAEVEHLLTGPDRRGVEQPRARTIRAEQARERVVEAQPAIVAGGRDVVVRGRAHGFPWWR